MSYCPTCGYDYTTGVSVCPDCGISLVEGDQALCPACEEEITQEVTTCPHCGILLDWGSETGEELCCATHTSNLAIGSCVICGIALCDECAHTRQRKMFCQSDFELKVAFDWVAVYSASTPYEAHMVKANLESANIPAMVLSQSDRMYYMTLGNLAVAEVMVPKTSYEEAKQFLQALEGGDSIADNDGIHD